MIDLAYFQLNILGILSAFLLLVFLFLKKIDILSILALTSSFYNLVLFNYKPWTFGFQIFFFFAIIFILASLKNLIVNLSSKNNLILIAPVFIFLIIVLLGEIFAYLNGPQILVIRPQEGELRSAQEIFKFSRLNITQFLYLIFFLMIFLSSAFWKNLDLLKIFKFYLLGLNLNLLFQIFEIFYLKIKKDLPNFLINFSFTQDTIQKVYLKHFEFYRISGLFPASSLLGIYIFIGFLILILFKEQFTKKFFFAESIFLILSGLISLSSTFLLGLIIALLLLTLKERKFILLFVLLVVLISLLYLSYRQNIQLRLQNAVFSLKIFLKFPIIGVGLGSHFSDDLLTTLLSNTGILGFLSFLIVFLIPFLKSLKTKNELLLNLAKLTLFPLILILLIWHSFNINIYWLILGFWYNKIKQCSG